MRKQALSLPLILAACSPIPIGLGALAALLACAASGAPVAASVALYAGSAVAAAYAAVAGVALARFARARGEVLPDRPWRFEATAETSEALGASLAVASRACPVPPGAFLGATSFLLRGPGRLDRVDSEEAGDTPIAEAPRRVLFPIALRRAEDGPGWLASCPVAPGCEAQGETYVGAVEAAKEAIALALEARAAGQEPAWPLPDGAAIVSVDLPEAPGPATLARADGTGERVPEQLGLAL